MFNEHLCIECDSWHCLFVCVCVYTHMRMWEHVCTYVWRPDVDSAMLASQ